MREVEVDRVVAATPTEIAHALGPADLIEFEGSFNVLDVETVAEGTFVTVGAWGVGVQLRFEERDDGLYYEQMGESGPFEEMWTTVTWEPEDSGSRVTARSGVSLQLPPSVITDRIAAWKRRGELKRALRNLAADLE